MWIYDMTDWAIKVDIDNTESLKRFTNNRLEKENSNCIFKN